MIAGFNAAAALDDVNAIGVNNRIKSVSETSIGGVARAARDLLAAVLREAPRT